MERFTIAIIGGGASGLFLASKLCDEGKSVALFERNDRLGKKLSATGNGQGNLTNLSVTKGGYFTSSKMEEEIQTIIKNYDDKHFCKYLSSLGILPIADERGRVYPAGRQASAITDALRFFIAEKGTKVCLQAKVVDIRKQGKDFLITTQTADGEKQFLAENVVLCAGGKASKNFGSDGNGYTLAKSLSHTTTPLFPSLVQLKTDVAHTKTLKGIRVMGGGLTASYGEKTHTVIGDIIFTEYGISGDAVFRISAWIADKIEEKLTLTIDFLPDVSKEKIAKILKEKQKNYPNLPNVELLGGILNNQVGRAILKRANGDVDKASSLVKSFPLEVKGSLGFDYAQVTKGGISLLEVDENLQSKKVDGLYFTGEILDVDGECGGYNLQWAYSSACVVADALKSVK